MPRTFCMPSLFPEDVQAEIESGRAWRAREILSGRIGSGAGYDTTLFEQYGNVLLLTGELYLAGKYLFLSGERNERYEEAISLFVSRQRGGWRDTVGRFPNRARLKELADFPPAVREELEKLG